MLWKAGVQLNASSLHQPAQRRSDVFGSDSISDYSPENIAIAHSERAGLVPAVAALAAAAVATCGEAGARLLPPRAADAGPRSVRSSHPSALPSSQARVKPLQALHPGPLEVRPAVSLRRVGKYLH